MLYYIILKLIMNLVQKLYRSRGVVLEMLEARNYNVNNYKNYTLKEINAMHKNTSTKTTAETQPLDILVKHNEKENIALVKYIYSSKIRINNILSLLTELKKDKLEHEDDVVIFITRDKITNENIFDAQLENIYQNEKRYVQVFWIDKLVINITKHELVPNHRILSGDEKENLLKKLDINNFTQLQLILKTDPVAKYYGMKRGDVCEILRSSETAGMYINYRYCN